VVVRQVQREADLAEKDHHQAASAEMDFHQEAFHQEAFRVAFRAAFQVAQEAHQVVQQAVFQAQSNRVLAAVRPGQEPLACRTFACWLSLA
jgi:hypothetical protein